MAIILKNHAASPSNRSYIVAAIRDGVIFPHSEVVLTFGRPRSVKAVEQSFQTSREIVFVTQKRAQVADPQQADLYSVGVLATIERTLKTNQEINALVRGLTRVHLDQVDFSGSYLTAQVTELPDTVPVDPRLEAMNRHLLNDFKRAVNLGKAVEFLNFMKLMSGVEAPELVDQIAATLDIPTKEKQQVLETLDLLHRFEVVINKLNHEIQILEIEKNITSKTQKKFDKSMRESVLRERLRTIQKELGDESDEEQEIDEFKKKATKAKLPAEVKQKVDKEINRFTKMSVHSPEYSYIRTWLETVLDMPWNTRSRNNVSIKKAEQVLEADHYGLTEVKERIIEYLSVLTLKKQNPALKDRAVPTILCFVGPPGVGKTSIGRSIARALHRKFVKVSLGGIRDEAEIRGHRRTYVGAMPGRIIQGVRQVGTRNPVFMLDEIDKVGVDFRGDPSAALLEALDPEQNRDFSDHYLEVPFDLSEVIFITTANVLDTIPPALKDRLEIITFSGYTEIEKLQIAKKHLMTKTLQANGLRRSQITLKPEALKGIAKNYTREAGVRNLEREISKVMRKAAKRIASGETSKVTFGKKDLVKYLGPIKFSDTLAEKLSEPGLATGLAWTQVGGDIIFVEVAIMPGIGKVILTGKLGQVMQESAKAAWSYVRSRWQTLGLPRDFYKRIDIHVHVPEGAVPKDGPSAGVTIATALISALTKKPVRSDLGMTGEITLRGRVLEIGGVKEKVIAGHRAGLRRLILPKSNKKDLINIPASVSRDISFQFVDHMDQVLKLALKA
ncbi:endopeptidase La [Microgenomates group bacterium RBG_16_45_19]|nr:MAG: endopeptidase La [Microgenomates group bacterium RBG_16_45_19]